MADLATISDPPAADDRSARAASLRSRAAVEAGNRDAWLALFAADAVVADPVGPSPLDPAGQGHRGPTAIAAFWDNVIGPNKVAMAVRSSHAGGNEVANAVTITNTFPDGSSASVDIVAVYRVDDDGLITSLRAYWEFDDLQFTPAPG
jgi:ketosteroid isomerase-like protein